MPKVDGGQNKIPPVLKGKKKPKKPGMRKPGTPPATSAANSPNGNADEPDADAPDPDNKGTTPEPEKDEDEEDDADILARALKRFQRCVAWESENRKAALEDLKFKAGDQWPADVAAQRNTDRRPCLTVNKIPTFIHQITNDQRENRPAIHVSPVGDKGDPEAAKIYYGMIRAIERDSSADIAYDTAFDGAVSNGFGYFRILTEFEDPMSRDQVIVIKRIRNPFTVYLDPDHQEPDGADCMYGFVTELVTRSEFKDTWPDADPMPFTAQGTGEMYRDWINSDTIRIAEYFEIKNKKKRLVFLENGWSGLYDDLSDDIKDKVKSKRTLIDFERETEIPTVRWYKLSAKEVLQRTDWLGNSVPIYPVIGNEIDIEGKVKLSGLIRDAKDAQRIVNYAVTAEIELVALAPKAPFIMEEGQVEGHEQEWKQANTKNYPVLFYKGTAVNGTPAPPPQRQPMVGSPAGWIDLKMGAAQDMMATTGIRFDPTQSDKRVDDSGVAIRELRRSGDLGSFHYVDNLGRTLRRAGRDMLYLIPKVYDSKRIITIIREDDTEEAVQLDPSSHKAFNEVQRPDGKKLKIFNPTMGRYGVTVTIGPSYATKRLEAGESMMAFAKALPNTASMIADLIAKYQDWPGGPEIAARLAKAVPPQLLTPDQKDIPPQLQAVMQNMDAQIKQLTQHLQQAMAALNDKDKDRAIALEKIGKDFEAKVLGVMQKAEDSAQKHVGFHIQNLARDVNDLREEIASSKEKPAGNQKKKE